MTPESKNGLCGGLLILCVCVLVPSVCLADGCGMWQYGSSQWQSCEAQAQETQAYFDRANAALWRMRQDGDMAQARLEQEGQATAVARQLAALQVILTNQRRDH